MSLEEKSTKPDGMSPKNRGKNEVESNDPTEGDTAPDQRTPLFPSLPEQTMLPNGGRALISLWITDPDKHTADLEKSGIAPIESSSSEIKKLVAEMDLTSQDLDLLPAFQAVEAINLGLRTPFQNLQAVVRRALQEKYLQVKVEGQVQQDVKPGDILVYSEIDNTRPKPVYHPMHAALVVGIAPTGPWAGQPLCVSVFLPGHANPANEYGLVPPETGNIGTSYRNEKILHRVWSVPNGFGDHIDVYRLKS
jgi:hypothetical protein